MEPTLSADEHCQTVQERLSDAFFARTVAARVDVEHADRCASCGAHRNDLEQLAGALAADPEPEPDPRLVDVTRVRAQEEMRRRKAARAAPPVGYAGELRRLVVFAALPLPVVLIWNLAVLSTAEGLLAPWLPAALLQGLAASYLLTGATWLACLFGSLPLIAHRQARLRALEVTS